MYPTEKGQVMTFVGESLYECCIPIPFYLTDQRFWIRVLSIFWVKENILLCNIFFLNGAYTKTTYSFNAFELYINVCDSIFYITPH